MARARRLASNNTILHLGRRHIEKYNTKEKQKTIQYNMVQYSIE